MSSKNKQRVFMQKQNFRLSVLHFAKMTKIHNNCKFMTKLSSSDLTMCIVKKGQNKPPKKLV